MTNIRRQRHSRMGRLVMVSNRVPPASDLDPTTKGAGAVGGLVSAVRASLIETGGMWVGWSGRTAPRRARAGTEVERNPGAVELATIDLTADESNLFYTGFSNRTLWPILHSFIERTQIRHDTYRAYRRVNRRYAQALRSVLREDDTVWIHDYHLFPVGEELRRLGWSGRLGFFLHTPFPGADIFSVLPWSRDLLAAMLSFDLIGVHTRRYMLNLVDAFQSELGGDWNGLDFAFGGRSARLGVYPIGIDPSTFQRAARGSLESLTDMLGLDPATRVIIGVDRLDYTKGIPHRLQAFSRMLEQHRHLHGKRHVRSDIQPVARPCSRIRPRARGRGTSRWGDQRALLGRQLDSAALPVPLLQPGESRGVFTEDADVNMVTPLRDGMNLIAKEFVVSQVADPGVLMLSSLAGRLRRSLQTR